MIAYPGDELGVIKVKKVNTSEEPISIKAHITSVTNICLSHDGKLLATASTKGTIIRVFNTRDGTTVKELRRGVENAQIFSIAFTKDSQYLSCTSDKLTLHVFSVRNGDSDKSIFRLKFKENQFIAVFGENNSLNVVTSDGNYYKYEVKQQGKYDLVMKQKLQY